MGGLSLWHWIVVAAVAFIVFGGRFKISDVMGDVAKGIKAFKKGMTEDDAPPAPASDAPKTLDSLSRDALAHDPQAKTVHTTDIASDKKV
jgi:sec-independent protein translocase protein TatA